MSADPEHTMAERLAEIARAVARLSVDRRDPEKFFEDKSEIAHALRRLARQAEVDR